MSPAQFHRATGVADWRVTALGPQAVFVAPSLIEGSRLVPVVVAAAERHGVRPDVDLRPEAVVVRVPSGEDGIPAAAKTSGASGLHIYIRLPQGTTYDTGQLLCRLIATAVADANPRIATIERMVKKRRRGTVYVDYLQNRRGQLLAAPWCVRPLPGAPVSTPLRWKEVGPRLDPRSFTIATVPARARRMKSDPLRGVLEDRPDVAAALARLAAAEG